MKLNAVQWDTTNELPPEFNTKRLKKPKKLIILKLSIFDKATHSRNTTQRTKHDEVNDMLFTFDAQLQLPFCYAYNSLFDTRRRRRI